MDYKKLETNLIDLIGEQQLKLGYLRGQVSFYYPLTSLQHLLGISGGISEMYEAFREFVNLPENKLGKLGISNRDDRFCITVMPEGCEYVHEHFDELPFEFLKEFLQVISKHGSSLDNLMTVFKKHSDHVRIEKMEDDEFDYCFYFEDGVPDDYRYCINFEGHHTTYHRFTEADYQDFGFHSSDCDIPD